MFLTRDIKVKILNEFNSWKDNQYNGKSKEERQKLEQFFTPPELTYKLIEQYDDLEGNILDPCCGSGNLLAGCILAGADPKKCYGYDIDQSLLDNVTIPRLTSLGVPKENIICKDYLK